MKRTLSTVWEWPNENFIQRRSPTLRRRSPRTKADIGFGPRYLIGYYELTSFRLAHAATISRWCGMFWRKPWRSAESGMVAA